MLLNRFRSIAVLSGVGVVAGIFALSPAMPSSLPSAGLVAGILLASASAIVFLVLFQGPPATIAQVLYNTEQGAPTGDRRHLSSRTDGVRCGTKALEGGTGRCYLDPMSQ